MKIAIYGVSRSGKDFFINDLIDVLKRDKNMILHHVNGSIVLKELSLKKYNREFKTLSELQKNNIRIEFIKKLNEIEKQYGSIVVDGHYAFYNDDMTFRKAFTEYDLNCYDYFFYLDTDSKDIVNRMRLSEGEKKNNIFTEEDIINWKNYEVDNMTDELLTIDKELHIIKYVDKTAIEYVLGVFNGEFDSKVKSKNIVKDINLEGYSSVILVDCDKTLSNEDTTSILMKNKNVDESMLKTIYKYDRYTNYQALEAKKYCVENGVYNDDACILDGQLTLNNILIDDLKTKTNTKIIAITAGNNHLWKKILAKTGLDVDVLDADFIMSKFVKYYVLKELQSMGKYVIAIGDSMLDSLMLRFANKSYIVANKGLRDNIKRLLINNPRIHQLTYSNYQYKNVYTDDCIDSIRCLTNLSEESKNNITICKSDSGIEGRKLRKAHYELGINVAKLISADYPNEEYVVVIMMRSGLCFGQGIADYFDCPELFYDESYTKKFEDEFYGNPKYKNKIIILVDGVVNSGKSMKEIVAKMVGYKTVIATNVISSKFNVDYIHPIYATRISGRSFVGAKQQTISNGKGPDTSDRLFRNF